MESSFQSLWMATSKRSHYPSLVGEIEVDVVIIGGGIAGVMAAYFLLKAGKSVAVIESHQIATGTSGFTTAKVTSMHDAKYAFLKNNFGLHNAKIYADSHQWAIKELENIVKTEKIKCSFSTTNSFLYTNETKSKEEFQLECDAAMELGLPASIVTHPAGLPFKIQKALRFSNQAQFHPRNFLLGICEYIHKHNGYIFEKTKAEQINDGKIVEVVTQQGKIKAKEIIIATNTPVYDTAALFIRMTQMRSYAFAFQTKDEVSNDMFIGLGEDEFTIRTHAQDAKKWVIIGGQAHIVGSIHDTKTQYEKLEKILRSHFDVQSIDYQWSAQDSSPRDRVPFIGRMPLSNHVLVTTGYGEWGMSTGIMSGKLLTDIVCEVDTPWQELYSPSRLNLKAIAGKSLEGGKQLLKGYTSYFTSEDKDSSTIQIGEGRVITSKGEKIAVSRNEQGKLCPLSAVCTHLHCVVEWNTAEKTWDCPCHGSRFDSNGVVIHGPAIQDLVRKEIT